MLHAVLHLADILGDLFLAHRGLDVLRHLPALAIGAPAEELAVVNSAIGVLRPAVPHVHGVEAPSRAIIRASGHDGVGVVVAALSVLRQPTPQGVGGKRDVWQCCPSGLHPGPRVDREVLLKFPVSIRLVVKALLPGDSGQVQVRIWHRRLVLDFFHGPIVEGRVAFVLQVVDAILGPLEEPLAGDGHLPPGRSHGRRPRMDPRHGARRGRTHRHAARDAPREAAFACGHRAHPGLRLCAELVVILVVLRVHQAEEAIGLVPIGVELALEMDQQLRLDLCRGRAPRDRHARGGIRQRLRPRPDDLELPVAMEEVIRKVALITLRNPHEVAAVGYPPRSGGLEQLLLPLHFPLPLSLPSIPMACIQRPVGLEVRIAGVQLAPALIHVPAPTASVHLAVNPILHALAIPHVHAADERVLQDAAGVVHDELLRLAQLRLMHHSAPEVVVPGLHADLQRLPGLRLPVRIQRGPQPRPIWAVFELRVENESNALPSLWVLLLGALESDFLQVLQGDVEGHQRLIHILDCFSGTRDELFESDAFADLNIQVRKDQLSLLVRGADEVRIDHLVYARRHGAPEGVDADLHIVA
mmetsp:Transcript_111174/g.319434  ORF Transcript_111174/g.319434 Transcript_111174/m.319434 type:complete len:585 (-) Transcript_111174:3807-5561(-)